ncbi:MAG TPA: hypothetical protein VIL08_07390, partial [Limnochorda sp.]
MSGIAGGLGGPDEKTVQRMLARLRHRGPDEQGCWVSEQVILGQNRLSIIDPTPRLHPVTNEDGTVIAVVDGEIYNFRALQAHLQARGHRLRSRGTAEVVVHLWEEQGPAMLSMLDGMFALALYDRPAGRLLLARDPLGIKPLYGGVAGETFFFASELGALLEATSQVWEFPQGHWLLWEVGRSLD